jgi:hypothetical protein
LDERPIGFLTPKGCGHAVVGLCCSDQCEHKGPPVYAVNVLPYRQTCSRCGETLVEGRTPAWPELFVGR